MQLNISDYVYGGDGNDTLCGRGGNDVLDGGDGDDFIDLEYGNYTAIGGNGEDILSLYGRINNYSFTQAPDGSVIIIKSGIIRSDLPAEHYANATPATITIKEIETIEFFATSTRVPLAELLARDASRSRQLAATLVQPLTTTASSTAAVAPITDRPPATAGPLAVVAL